MKLLLVTLVTCLALKSTCSQAGPVSQASLVSNGAMDGERGSLCPKGFEAISQNLDGAGKIWSQPHPLATRTKDECAAICLARSGCTSFEFAEGESYHGACGTYTGGHANVQGDENRLSANSNWRSCLLKPYRGSLCPKGFKAISQNLDGAGKIWSQPHPMATRTNDECAAICMSRSGCTSFEFAEGESYHGACGTYTGGHANVQGDENRLSANSNWRSCLLKPSHHHHIAGKEQLLIEGVLTNTTVAEGNKFKLGCEVRTKRQMDLKWLKKVDKNYRDEHASFLHLQTGRYMVLSPSSSTRHAIADGYRITVTVTLHTLKVLSAAPEDSGEYMCAIFLPDRDLQTNHQQLHQTILANQSATVTVIPKGMSGGGGKVEKEPEISPKGQCTVC